MAGGAAIYPLVQNLILGIRAEGLGDDPDHRLVPVEDEVKQLLRMPADTMWLPTSAIGRPERPLPTRLSRRPVEDFATVNYFGGTAFSG